MSDIIVEDAIQADGIRMKIRRYTVLLRALLYFALAVGICAILPYIREMTGVTALLFVAGCCMLLLLTLFVHECVCLYRSCGMKNWRKYAAIDMGCICLGMVYWFIAHAVWYKPGTVRFYDAIILAVLALPYVYRIFRIFGLPGKRDGSAGR